MERSPNLPICPRTCIGLKRWNKLSGETSCIDTLAGNWFGSCWYHTALRCTTEKIKHYSGCRACLRDLRNHWTETGYKSQLDSFVDTVYSILLYHRIIKCLSSRKSQHPERRTGFKHTAIQWTLSPPLVHGSAVHSLPKSRPAMKTWWDLALVPVMEATGGQQSFGIWKDK